MTPRVTIHTDSSLDDLYAEIQARINATHHNYQTTFPRYANTEKEYAALQALAAWAGHVSDNLPPGVDWERVVK
jgi:hypothetical protein